MQSRPDRLARDLLTTRTLESSYGSRQLKPLAETLESSRDGASLMLIVRPSGRASWVLEYRHAGQRMPLTLGAWPDVSLKIARDLAQDARGLVAKGIDPNVKKRDDLARKKGETEANPYTVHRLFEEWMSKKTGSEVDLDNIRAAFVKDVLPEIGSTAPRAVTGSRYCRLCARPRAAAHRYC